MILNVSGRCDIVAFYTPWFINRYREGYVDVRNPFYNKQVSRIYFKDVDLIVFCTKNPVPIISYISKIKIPIIFHVTITPYHRDIEPGVYNSCKHYCRYCYANYDENKVDDNYKNHYVNSSLLIGKLTSEDIIKVRK